EAPAPEAKSFNVSTKYEIIKALEEIDITLDDLMLPGFSAEDLNTKPEERRSVWTPFSVIRAKNLKVDILNSKYDPDPENGDEGEFFARGIRASDHSSAILRVVEGRIAEYRYAITLCKNALSDLQNLSAEIDKRLQEVEDHLAEARHDVSTARA